MSEDNTKKDEVSKEKLKINPAKVGVLSDADLDSLSGGMRRAATDAADKNCNTDATNSKCSGSTC